MVENNTELEIVLQNGDKIAEISPVDQEMMLDELGEQAKEQEAQFAAHLNQIGQTASQLTAEECQEKLTKFLSFTSPELTEKEKQAAVGLLKKNHDCFALEEGDIRITEGIEVEIEMEDAHPVRQ